MMMESNCWAMLFASQDSLSRLDAGGQATGIKQIGGEGSGAVRRRLYSSFPWEGAREEICPSAAGLDCAFVERDDGMGAEAVSGDFDRGCAFDCWTAGGARRQGQASAVAHAGEYRLLLFGVFSVAMDNLVGPVQP